MEWYINTYIWLSLRIDIRLPGAKLNPHTLPFGEDLTSHHDKSVHSI